MQLASVPAKGQKPVVYLCATMIDFFFRVKYLSKITIQNQSAVNPTESRSPNSSICDKRVYEPVTGNTHAFMHSYMHSVA